MGVIVRGPQQQVWLDWLREGHCVIAPVAAPYTHSGNLSWTNFVKRMKAFGLTPVMMPQIHGRPQVTHCFLLGAEHICGGCQESIPKLVTERLLGRPLDSGEMTKGGV